MWRGLLAAPSPAAPSPAPAPTPMPSPANTGFGPLPPCVSLQSFENWHRELREAFDEHAHIENEDEGHALYADVWFIDNVNYKTCRQPAKIKLLAEDTMWFPQIMECWILDAGLCSCASSCCSTTSSSHNFAVFHFAHPH